MYLGIMCRPADLRELSAGVEKWGSSNCLQHMMGEACTTTFSHVGGGCGKRHPILLLRPRRAVGTVALVQDHPGHAADPRGVQSWTQPLQAVGFRWRSEASDTFRDVLLPTSSLRRHNSKKRLRPSGAWVHTELPPAQALEALLSRSNGDLQRRHVRIQGALPPPSPPPLATAADDAATVATVATAAATGGEDAGSAALAVIGGELLKALQLQRRRQPPQEEVVASDGSGSSSGGGRGRRSPPSRPVSPTEGPAAPPLGSGAASGAGGVVPALMLSLPIKRPGRAISPATTAKRQRI
eukprot:COSAG01_NODE_297_length_19258_cov_8.905110_6_plen_297_part_00